MRKIKNFLNIFVIRLQWSKRKENIVVLFSIFLLAVYVYLFYMMLSHNFISNNEFLFLIMIAIFGAFLLNFIKFKDKPQVTKMISKNR